jgi:uncharacterized protein with von Willebrand factor type A (vWA) domain
MKWIKDLQTILVGFKSMLGVNIFNYDYVAAFRNAGIRIGGSIVTVDKVGIVFQSGEKEREDEYESCHD